MILSRLMIAAALASVVTACSSSQGGPTGPDPAPTGDPVATSEPTEIPTQAPTVEPAPTGTPVPTATATAVAPPTKAALVASADVARGKSLWEENHCGGCHGTAAKPSAKFPNVFAGAWADERIDKAFNLVKKGKSPMPGFGDKLEDKHIADLVAFMKSGGK